MKILYYLLLILIAVYLVESAPSGINSEERKAIKNEKSKDRKNKRAKDSNGNEEKQVKQFDKQLKALFKLKCKPIKSKVSVRSLLGTKSQLHDLAHVYPEFVVIKKCNQACTFCKLPSDDLGIESQLCISSKNKTKKVLVKYRNKENKWKYVTVKTTEDKKCECVLKEDITTVIPSDEKVVSR